MIICVRPGVFDTSANCLRFANALISDDFPTFDRPTKATSDFDAGKSLAFGADFTKLRASGGADIAARLCPARAQRSRHWYRAGQRGMPADDVTREPKETTT